MIPDDHLCSFRRGKTWYTFKHLEDMLNKISRHITFSKKNKDTWSEELASFLILSGSSVDTFFRNMVECPYLKNHKQVNEQEKIIKKREIEGGSSYWGIYDYREALEPIYEFSKNTISVPFGLDNYGEITPFENFDKKQPPAWWTAYNKMKHDYYDSIKEHATLENSICCLGGLLILNSLHKCSQEYLVMNRLIRDKHDQTNPRVICERLQKSMKGYFSLFAPFIRTEQFIFKLRKMG